MSVTVCTAVARNYLAQARVLAESVLEHHPEATVRVLVVDPDPPLRADEPFEPLTPADAGMDGRELARRALAYPTQALVSAARPSLISASLARTDGEPVLYLDADILVCGDLTDVVQQAKRDTILLSPHSSLPLPHVPGGDAPEEVFIRAGAFNGGCIGVAPGAEPFLAWMVERCRRDCVQDSERGHLLSQSWLQLAPALFPHGVLRDPGCNVMAHNLGERDVEWTSDGPTIGGLPLRFYHFAGFDPFRPERLTKHATVAPWQELDAHPGVARLVDEYVARLRAAGLSESWSSTPYGANLPDGTVVTPSMRRAYLAGLIAAEREGTPEPPNPFADAGADRFLDWLAGPADGAGDPRLSPYLMGVLAQRADLRVAFPQVPGPSTGAFLEWVDRELGAQDPAWPVIARHALASPTVAGPQGTPHPGREVPPSDHLVPLLIDGRGRGGTTLLMALLGTSPEVAFEPEYAFEHGYFRYFLAWSRLIDAEEWDRSEWNQERLREEALGGSDARRQIGPPPWLNRELVVPRGDEETLGRRCLRAAWREFSLRIVDRAREQTGIAPRYHAEKCRRAWAMDVDEVVPAVIITLIRDPRDTWASILAFDEKRGFAGFGRRPGEPEQAYLDRLIDDYVAAAPAIVAALGAGKPVVRYESLVNDLPGVARDLGERLGLVLDPTAVPRFEDFPHHVTSPTPEASVGRWRRDLSDQAVDTFRARMGRELELLGYEP